MTKPVSKYDALFDEIEIAFTEQKINLPFDLLQERMRPIYGTGPLPEAAEFAKIVVEFYEHSRDTYDFDKSICKFMGKGNAFLTEVSRWVKKVNNPSVGTAGLGYDANRDEFMMLYNPGFMGLLTEEEHNGVITHELFHLIFKHVTSRRKEPHIVCNIAQDEAINSLIVKDGGKLPPSCLMPGQRPKTPKKGFSSPEAKLAHETYADIIEGSPPMESSEYYFELLMTMNQKGKGKFGWNANGLFAAGKDGEEQVDVGPMDNHDLWDTIPEELRGLVEGKRKSIVEKAVRKADGQANGWGNIPESVREEIRASVSDCVDWKTLLSRFPGKHIRGKTRTSIHRINKRYPYVHSGRSLSYLPLVLIAIDQSGSVDNSQLEEVFAVLGNLARKTTFHMINFDTDIDHESFQVWRRGTNPVVKRTKCGGTNFDCVQNWVESRDNKNEYQCVVICTDGECFKPPPSKIPRAWVLTRGHKLMFQPDQKDIVIHMDDKVSSGGLNDHVR